MKKILKHIFIYMAIGSLFTIVGLTIADNFIYSLNNTTATTQNTDSLKDVSNNNITIKLDNASTLMQYSYNNKYYTYLKDGKIYINDTKTGKVVDTIKEDNPICFYNLLYDKNLIIYFTEKKTGTSSNLTLETYDIESKNKIKHDDFTVNNFVKIKELEGSPVINIMYINIETKSGSKVNNTVYRIDLFKGMSQVLSGKIISKLVMLKQKDKLYYEDENENIYSSGSKIGIFKENVDLIGLDLNDDLYFISSKKDKVYKVQNNKIVDTIPLTDTDVVGYYSDNTNVYIVYPTYIISVSSTDTTKKLVKLSNYVTFETIKSNTVYLKTSDNTIILEDMVE